MALCEKRQRKEFTKVHKVMEGYNFAMEMNEI